MGYNTFDPKFQFSIHHCFVVTNWSNLNDGQLHPVQSFNGDLLWFIWSHCSQCIAIGAPNFRLVGLKSDGQSFTFGPISFPNRGSITFTDQPSISKPSLASVPLLCVYHCTSLNLALLIHCQELALGSRVAPPLDAGGQRRFRMFAETVPSGKQGAVRGSHAPFPTCR